MTCTTGAGWTSVVVDGFFSTVKPLDESADPSDEDVVKLIGVATAIRTATAYPRTPLEQRTVDAVLDGGWQAWTAAGQPTTAEPPAVQRTTYTLRPRPDLAVDAGYVAAHLHDPEVAVLDARSDDRFRGENETLDPVAGHIPGAVNRFFRLNLDAKGRFKPPETLNHEISTLLDGRDSRDAVHQCGSGVTACHNLLAMEHAGLMGSRLYAGSWSEWVSDPARPVAQ